MSGRYSMKLCVGLNADRERRRERGRARNGLQRLARSSAPIIHLLESIEWQSGTKQRRFVVRPAGVAILTVYHSDMRDNHSTARQSTSSSSSSAAAAAAAAYCVQGLIIAIKGLILTSFLLRHKSACIRIHRRYFPRFVWRAIPRRLTDRTQQILMFLYENWMYRHYRRSLCSML